MENSVLVAGFQFKQIGIEISDASGGRAEEAGFIVNTSLTTVLGFSATGATIPPGEGVLTQVFFTDFEGTDICFGNDATFNVVSDPDASAIYTVRGDCVCPAGVDECCV
jgi:hypothetical protein